MQTPITPEEIKRRLEVLLVARQAARTDLLYLCQRILGYTDVSCEVHGEILDHLQKFTGGTEHLSSAGIIGYAPSMLLWKLKGPRSNLILFPRGHLKTSIITIAHTIQWILNYPDIRILISTATGDQVKKMLTEIKGHFQFNNKFRMVFPDYCPPPKKAADWGNQEEFTVPNRSVVKKEPTVSTCSVGKVIAGAHYEVIKNSDLVDKENVKTPNQIADVISHFGYLNPLLERSALPPHHGWVDVEGTRYDFGDLYGRLLDSGTYASLIRPRDNQDSVWPERFPETELARIEKEVGPYIFSCFPSGAPVLMADWSEKPIADVRPGMEVIGFKQGPKRYELCKAKVEAIHAERGQLVEVTMKSGRYILCTPDHKFWIYNKRKYRTPKEGRTLCSVYTPEHYWPSGSADAACGSTLWNWLGGILDGEGSCHKKNAIFISQDSKKNPEVHKMIETVFQRLELPYKKHPDYYYLTGGRSVKMRVLRHCWMAKRQRFIDSLWAARGVVSESTDRIVSVKPNSECEVYNIQTSTGNYVCYGYAAKNCQYKNKPIPPEGGLCDPKDIVFLSRATLANLQPMLRLHCTIDLHGLEPAKNDNDYTVLTVGGFDRDGRLYVLDIRRGRFTPDKVIWHVFDVHSRYPSIIDFKIEKDAHARVLLPFLQREASKRQRFPCFVPIKRDTHVSKQQRIRGLQPWFRAGIIRFADDLGCKTDLILEIMQFPSQSSGVHDDVLDTLADMMQNQEGGVTDDVVADYDRDPRQQFGGPKVLDKFLGFDEKGISQWLYGTRGEDEKQFVTGVL